jgi:cell division protein FtsW
MASRAIRTPLSSWWWTVDRWLLAGVVTLVVSGLVLIMAASPAVAERINLPTFHFVHRQFMYLAPALFLMGATSFLEPRHVRRAALLLYAGSMALIVLALVHGTEVKGARRWIFGIQPSEFVKPAFVILAAWAFAEGAKRKGFPGTTIAVLLLPMTVVPLILQPDFGQTMLIAIVWGGLFFMAGLHWLWVAGIFGGGLAGVFAAYTFLPHVRGRFQRFLEGGASGGDTFQVDTAMQSLVNGGWFGVGPGEGQVKRILPDSHTDFIFAVLGEEFGVIACIALATLFCAVVLRGLALARRDDDPFCRFAASGLVMLFGLQSCINMMVNLQLMPAKGMTLPFISYGGSSLISLALLIGFLIALTRRRPSSGMAEYGRVEED